MINNPIKVLSEDEIEKVHEHSVRILKEIGVVFKNREALDIFKYHGAKVDNEIVYFNDNLISKALKNTPSSFIQHGLSPEKSVRIGGPNKDFVVSAQNGVVFISDLENGRRKGKSCDYENIIKLSQSTDIIKVVGGIPVEPSDYNDENRILKILYSTLKHSDKPIHGWSGNTGQVNKMFEMINIVAGADNWVQEHPMIANAINPLTPLIYDVEPIESVIAYTKANQPIYINSCMMSGLTGPISLMGTVTLMNAEILAGLVLVQLINPGNPFIYVPGSTVGNMKNSSFNTGSPENNLIAVAGIQMGKDMYNIPTRAMSGSTDSKIIDVQAGFETMQAIMYTMLAGVDFINQSTGCLESIMTTSLEKFILDLEIVERVIRLQEGFTGTDKDFSFDIIKEVGHGGNYILHPSTFENFKKRWRPSISNWETYENWKNDGSQSLESIANKRYKKLLEESPETILDKSTLKDLERYIC